MLQLQAWQSHGWRGLDQSICNVIIDKEYWHDGHMVNRNESEDMRNGM